MCISNLRSTHIRRCARTTAHCFIQLKYTYISVVTLAGIFPTSCVACHPTWLRSSVDGSFPLHFIDKVGLLLKLHRQPKKHVVDLHHLFPVEVRRIFWIVPTMRGLWMTSKNTCVVVCCGILKRRCYCDKTSSA